MRRRVWASLVRGNRHGLDRIMNVGTKLEMLI